MQVPIRRAATLALALSLSACALAPNSVRPEFEYMSHIDQHEPFTSHPTDDGADLVWLLAHWDVKRRAYVEISEGYSQAVTEVEES